MFGSIFSECDIGGRFSLNWEEMLECFPAFCLEQVILLGVHSNCFGCLDVKVSVGESVDRNIAGRMVLPLYFDLIG